MAWIKNNVFWVIGGLIAIGLLGGSSWFLYSALQMDKEIDAQLAKKRAKLTELASAKPHPGVGEVDNMTAAKADAERVQKFLDRVRAYFVPIQVPEVKDSREFKMLLNNTLFELNELAEASQVSLPSQPFPFTFKAQSEATQFDPKHLPAFATQLSEIGAICDILFRSRIHAIESLRRTPISRDETSTADFLAGKTPATNSFAIHTPYEFTFRGFSTELAAVLDALARSSNAYIIKSFHVSTTTLQPSGELPAGPIPFFNPYMMRPAPGAEGSGAGAMDYRMMMRYGGMMRSRMMPPPEVQAPPASFAAAPVKPAVTNALDEKPLKITLLIETVRPKPAPAAEATRPKAAVR
jgi:hypothetical protein